MLYSSVDYISDLCVTLFERVAALEDPRTGRAKRHELTDIVVIAICGILSGAESWVEIAAWGELKRDWLQRFLKLPHGIPSHDTFGRVFRLLDATHFEQVFRGWVSHVIGTALDEVIAIDGKTVRGAKGQGLSAVHLVSAWATRTGLTLGQVRVDDKSNEITAIPVLLESLALQGCVVTIDAMGCQREIARKVRERGGDYLLAVKGNQPALEEQVTDFFDTAHQHDFRAVAHEYCETVEKDHGRIEQRRYWLVQNLGWLDVGEDWCDIHQVGMVESRREINGKVSLERRYYISSATASVQTFANAVRSHWAIENSQHWTLDVTFREDECRVRKDHAAHNFAILRRFVLNLMKLDTSMPKLSLRGRRKRAAWSDEYREVVLGMKADF